VLSSIFIGRWQLILGALFVIFVLFVRGGMVGIWTRLRERRSSGAS
jgi:ABC-type branched-subunit amino acid transport system permease subunit